MATGIDTFAFVVPNGRISIVEHRTVLANAPCIHASAACTLKSKAPATIVAGAHQPVSDEPAEFPPDVSHLTPRLRSDSSIRPQAETTWHDSARIMHFSIGHLHKMASRNVKTGQRF